MEKNILVIKLSPIYGLNSSMMRTIALTNGLLEMGYNIDFLTVPSSSTHVISEGEAFFNKINIIETSANIKYDSVVKNEGKGFMHKSLVNILRKTYHKLSIYNYTYDIAKKIDRSILSRNHYDFIISVSDPKTSHIAAKKLINQGIKYDKWIQYWGDPMAIDITNKSIYPNFVIKNIENKLIEDADKIIYASPITFEKQKKQFKKHSDKMFYSPTPYIKPKVYPKTNNDVYKIGYYGAYKKNVRNIMPLYNSCKNLNGKVELTIIGDTDIELPNTNNITVLSRRDINDYEKDTDLLVCMMNKEGTQIPGKIFHYASTNKAILLLKDGEYGAEISNYFESFGRYLICDNDTDEITRTILSAIKINQEYQPCKDFNSINVAKKIIETVNK